MSTTSLETPGSASSPSDDPLSSINLSKSSPLDAAITRNLTLSEVNHLKQVVWGRELKEDVFERWSQGFVFSDDEPAALVQEGGGPCAVITPVQGFIIKNLLSKCGEEAVSNGTWRQCQSIGPYSVLVSALCEMLQLVAPPPPNNVVRIVHVVETERDREEEDEETSSRASSSDIGENNGVDKESDAMRRGQNHTQNLPSTSVVASSSSPPKRARQHLLSHEEFHASLAVTECTTRSQLEETLLSLERKRTLAQRFAVLTFLYSSLLTKGLDGILGEVEDPSEPLIDGLFGHGSQSLLNLQITGAAVSNVFDDERDLGGYKLQGVKRQAPLGFLSFLEHLRYCEVGWYLKNPSTPIWVLGSETHFTLAFSPEKKLIVTDSPLSNGRRAFKQFDPEGNGFISANLLKDLLASLDFVSEPPEFVNIMKDKLDPEGLEIIVLNNFLREFYGDADTDLVNEIPKNFKMYHYNGLRKSGDPRLSFSEATARIDEPGIIVTDATPIKLCLQTKWPTLEIDWTEGNTPSLN